MLEVLALESPQPPTHQLFQPLHILSPHHSPILSPEPEQPIAPKRHIAPTLVTTELPATSTSLGQPLVLIPPPMLAPHEAREQLRSAFAQSQPRPFQTFMRRRLVACPTGDPHIDPLLPVLVSAKSADEMVPKFLAAANNAFWLCRHASFKQGHIIAQGQALEASSQEQAPRRSALDANMAAMQSWMWRHMRANSELLHGTFDDGNDDDEVLPLYGESDDEGSEGEYSDSFLCKIHADQLETSKRHR
ncbi:hypothetical protein GGF42_004210 [Coemansia sp. RSA 2424]|nr:hypothetical protein GGF42_004210 [Coemansia sp. RSA 2424]